MAILDIGVASDFLSQSIFPNHPLQHIEILSIGNDVKSISLVKAVWVFEQFISYIVEFFPFFLEVSFVSN